MTISRERLIELAKKADLLSDGSGIPPDGLYFKALEAFANLVLAEDKDGAREKEIQSLRCSLIKWRSRNE